MKRVTKLLRALPALLALTLSVPAMAGDAGPVPLPEIPPATKGEHCVQPTEVMRRNHYVFLLQHRDKTMHEGIRTKKYSLKECLDCHATNEPTKDAAGRTEATNQFCINCHQYAGVQIDCFECHSTKPEKSAQFHPIVTPGMKQWKDAHESASTALLNQLAKNNSKAGAAQ